MLKKLLASALAVATVASCAYVPSALASAATTYRTADAVAYDAYILKNPPAAAEKANITVHVSGDATQTINKEIEAAKNTEEYVASQLKGWITSAAITAADSTAAVKYEVSYFTKVADNVYLATVAKTRAVIFSTIVEATAMADDAEMKDLQDNVQLLGYYADTAAGQAEALKKVTADYTSQAKKASAEFRGWKVVAGTGANATKIVPDYVAITSAGYYYDEVAIVRAKGYGATHTAYGLETGSYAIPDANASVDPSTANTASVGSVYVPKTADAATREQMIINYLKTNIDTYTSEAFWKFQPSVVVDATTTTKYNANGVKLIANATSTTPAKYAVTYVAASEAAAKKKVKYTLNVVCDTATPTTVYTSTKDKEDANDYIFTTDADVVYGYVKGANDKATLAEQLLNVRANKQYKWDGETYTQRDIVNTSSAHTVVVTIKVVEYNPYTVYSYSKDGAVVKTDKVYLNKDQLTTGTSPVANTLTKVTAEDLGIKDTSVTIDGVPAEYAYAVKYDGAAAIKTVYAMGDATAAITDFATATGEFDAKAYFNRAAKAGDVVTLKVSFNEIGDAKVLDLKKVSVEYNGTVGATKGDQFTYSERYSTEVYKDGVATEFTLAAGTNIITATVKYDGKVIGTLAPFYAAVVE